MKNLYYKLVSTRDDGFITSVCGEGSDEPACTHDLARTFASRINKVCKLKKTPNIFLTSSLSGHARMGDY